MILLLLACGTTCEVAPLDYKDDALWLCRPGLDGACPPAQDYLVYESDGDLKEEVREYTSSTDVACFVVYPTLDNRIGTGLHLDVTDVPAPTSWARAMAAPLASVCDVYVPIYRQVLIGTYAGEGNAKTAQCLDSAYGDVEAAFEAFLEAEPTRGFALVGHSQGSQHLSRLIRERIETDDAVAERLVAGYLLGWGLGSPSATELTGGSFEKIPLCSDPETPGCVQGFVSFLSGEQVPSRGSYEEGDVRACVNPAAPGESGPHLLASVTVSSTTRIFGVFDDVEPREDLLLEYHGVFEATCTEGDDRALELAVVRPEVTFSDTLLVSELGAHPIDVNVALADIQSDLVRRATAWSAR